MTYFLNSAAHLSLTDLVNILHCFSLKKGWKYREVWGWGGGGGMFGKAHLISWSACSQTQCWIGDVEGWERQARPQPLFRSSPMMMSLHVWQLLNSLMHSFFLCSFLVYLKNPPSIPMASNNTASIAQARKLVEQLKMEANIDRIKVRTT